MKGIEDNMNQEVRYQLRIDRHRIDRFRLAAKASGRKLAAWLKALADRELEAPTLPNAASEKGADE